MLPTNPKLWSRVNVLYFHENRWMWSPMKGLPRNCKEYFFFFLVLRGIVSLMLQSFSSNPIGFPELFDLG